MDQIIDAIARPWRFKGRMSRGPYWIFLLIWAAVLGFVRDVPPEVMERTDIVLVFIWMWFLLAGFTAQVRRLRDAGFSPWWVIAPIVRTIMCLMPSRACIPELVEVDGEVFEVRSL